MQGVQDISWELYHKAPGVSKSALDYIEPTKGSPLKFKAYIDGKLPDEETPALRLGKLIHRVCLQPDTLDGAFYVKPEGLSFATKDGKAWRAEHSDRELVTHAEAKQIEAMRDALWSHSFARRHFAGAEMERSLFASDANGILRKGRLDALTPGNIIPDLKSVESVDDHWWQRRCADGRWHVQAAYYIDLCELLGIEKVDFVCVCVEKHPPYDVVCRSFLEVDLIEPSRHLYQRDLAVMRNCIKSGRWPGRAENEYLPADLPAWEMKELSNL